MQFDTTASDDEIQEVLLRIPDESQQTAMFDVLLLLRDGNVSEAERRVDLYVGASRVIDSLSEEEMVEIRDGETVKLVPLGSPEYLALLDQLMRRASYHEWMLFMHPEQQRIVERDFDGPAKLSGVSGSGKTAIVVKRTVRLAGETGGRPVLVLTLNRSLAMLIRRLVNYAAPNDEICSRVYVKSLFELCQELLRRFEPQNEKLYNDVTWKHEEHIDEIWREYYRCYNNNNDAAVLTEIHKSLNARRISGETYLRQEFDWVRSAFRLADREAYLRAERSGRTVGLLEHWRDAILQGLQGWEEKMRFVGVTDHLGLACSLEPYLDQIEPEYGAVLVDEMQDFGTIELAIVRRLVSPGKNDIFLCGDLAQRVQTKHQSLREAGIEVPSAWSLTICRNYRNSREILRGAYEVLKKAIPDLRALQGEVELLDPELSNFSTWAPLVLRGPDLETEFGAALDIARQDTSEDGHRACIAFAGFSLRDVQKFGVRVGLPVLDGTKGLEEGRIFLSDLEQTKGYEFDTMCILNCSEGVLPPHDMPREEWYRDACRLYVAMTRTKRQLILSYSSDVSPWLAGCSDVLTFDSWSEHVDLESVERYGVPKTLPDIDDGRSIFHMTGPEFLYSSHSLGLSPDLQERLASLIDGRGLFRDGRRQKWKTIGDAVKDVRQHPWAKQLFGPKTHQEFLQIFEQRTMP
jgi:hypothetical protein